MVKFMSLFPILAGLLGAANAHTRVWSLWVNDVDQGDGRGIYIRSPPLNSPVKDVTSTDIICNTDNVAVAKSVSVKAGDKVTFEWYHDNRGDDIVDPSHKGPITVYIADASSNGHGAVWTKISESGLSNGVWAVQTLISNKGKYSVTLPSTLAAGDYLLRAEVIALHEADTDYTVNSARGAQFYPSCSQVIVTSGGSSKPPGTFNFIGGYTHNDPGILFNLYGGPSTYPIPGPAVWDGSASGSSSHSSAVKSTSSVAAVKTTYTAPAVVPTTSAAAAVKTTTTVAKPTTTAAADTTCKSTTAAAAHTTTYKPTSTYKPTTTHKPTSTYKPATTHKPTPTYKPTTTHKPTSTYKPTTPTYKSTTIHKPTTTYKPTPTYKPTTTHKPTTYKPTTTHKPTPTYKPTTIAAAHTTLVTKTRKYSTKNAATATDTSCSPPAATSTPKSSVEINKCLDAVNACIAQAQSSVGGVVNFEPCESRRALCY